MEQIIRANRFQIEALEERIAPSPALVDVHNVKVTVKDINLGVNANVLGNAAQGNFQQ
jgi:hypothetical protein